jgi:transcriptional regulator with XRE-family HTH domain
VASKQELGAFLRAHRERLTPSDVGLAGGSRRRTPGLRREEVAALSGVGLAWYTWLEQGRVDTSRQVLDAVSRALRLDPDSHGHVLALAGLRPAADAPVDLTAVLSPLVDAWPGPAAAVDRRFDVITANPAHLDLWRLPERNLVLLLTDPAVRERVPEWEPLAQDVFRQFRMHADRHPDDPRPARPVRGATARAGVLVGVPVRAGVPHHDGVRRRQAVDVLAAAAERGPGGGCAAAQRRRAVLGRGSRMCTAKPASVARTTW